MSCPWKLLPVSTSNGLPSQSNTLRPTQVSPFSESDDFLSIEVGFDTAIFISSTNDACLIQDPGIWSRNRRSCSCFDNIIFIRWIFCFPKIYYLFTHGIIFCKINLFLYWRRWFLSWWRLFILWRFWTSWWWTLLFPLICRFLSLLRASCTSGWLFIWISHWLIISFRFLSLLRYQTVDWFILGIKLSLSCQEKTKNKSPIVLRNLLAHELPCCCPDVVRNGTSRNKPNALLTSNMFIAHICWPRSTSDSKRQHLTSSSCQDIACQRWELILLVQKSWGDIIVNQNHPVLGEEEVLTSNELWIQQ